jgi:hypothetical protein
MNQLNAISSKTNRLYINKYMRKNDPNDNRKFNYLYKITNITNNKIYIGVHRTDNMEDGYMGSGTNIKRAISKYGIENFKKEIIAIYSTYKEALEHESSIVTEDFINSVDTYNIKVGGYGPCIFSEEHKKKVSESRKKRFKEEQEFRKKYLDAARNIERRKKISINHKKWIEDNPDQHRERMLKINTNSDKIKKTALWHQGKKRSANACKNISEGIKASLEDPEVRKRRSGIGCKYYYNPDTGEARRFMISDNIPTGWKLGTGPRTNK